MSIKLWCQTILQQLKISVLVGFYALLQINRTHIKIGTGAKYRIEKIQRK